MKTLLAIDFDRHAAATYRANFPDMRVECGPVADFIGKLPDADVVIGGPPCQPHSLAGKREASKDARDCGPDYVAAVQRVKPRMFLMENVPSLLSSENGAYFARLLAALEVGYVVQYRTLDAVNFGVPQFRNRLWVWGIRADLYREGIRHCWPRPTHEWPPPGPSLFGESLLPGVTVGQALGLEGWIERGQRGKGYVERNGDRDPSPTTEPSPTVGNGANGSNRLVYAHGVAVPEEPSPTLKAGGNYANGKQGGGSPPIIYRWSDAMLQKHPPASPASPAPTVQAKYFKGGAEGLLHWKQTADGLWVRRLTPLECARLQSMPDDFRWPEKISKTAMYRVVGNGWASMMGKVFADAFRAADPDSQTVIDLFCGGGLGAVGWHGKAWNYEGRVAA